LRQAVLIMTLVMSCSAMEQENRAADELRLRREAHDSLLKFTEYTHPRWVSGDHHEVMCRWCELLESGEPCPCCNERVWRLALFAPPRHSKTEIVGRRFPAWYMGRHPTRQIVYGTAIGDLAKDVGADVRGIVGSEEYGHIFNGVSLKPDQKAAGKWLTNKGGVAFFTGVDGTVIGRGANLAILDDLHGGRNKADSKRERDVVENWYWGDVDQRAMRPNAQLFMFTRWNTDDLAARVLPPQDEWVQVDDRGWVYKADDWHVVSMAAIQHEGTDHEEALWPGESEDDDKVDENAEHLAGFPLEWLQAKRAKLLNKKKARDWNAQYQQKPQVEEGTYMRRTWLESAMYDTLPTNLHYYIASDYAVTDENEGPDPDYTSHGVFGIDHRGDIYVVEWWTGQTTSDVWINELLPLVKKHEPFAAFGTKGVIRRSIEPLLTRLSEEAGIFVPMEWLNDDKDKAAKGRPFQSFARQNRVHFPRGRPWAHAVIDQCVGFLAGAKHDDDFDVMANMCRAIADAHPAIIDREGDPDDIGDSYDNFDDRDTDGDWMTS